MYLMGDMVVVVEVESVEFLVRTIAFIETFINQYRTSVTAFRRVASVLD